MTARWPIVRLIGPPQADGEYVALRTPGSGEEIVHLHDYERFYRVPGLYEHIIQDLLGCRSPEVAADALESALNQLSLDPAGIVLLDLGAGTGVVGELATSMGVSTVIGVDVLDLARTACMRDRPGIYRDYLVGDLAAPHAGLLEALRRHRPTALISAGALGGTHAPPTALINALGLLPTGAPVVFTIDERWMRTDDAGGFRTPVARLLSSGHLRLLHRSRFQHRVSTAGSPITYELFCLVVVGGVPERPAAESRGVPRPVRPPGRAGNQPADVGCRGGGTLTPPRNSQPSSDLDRSAR